MLAALALVLQSVTLEPRRASWDELAREVFDPAWILPSHLPFAEDEPGRAWELETELARRVAFSVPPSAIDPSVPRCFGDLVAQARGLDRKSIEALLARVQRAQPELWRGLAPFAAELLFDDALFRGDWNPDRDSDRDGILFARPLTLARERSAFWKSIGGSHLVQQGAAFVRADVATIKAVENDFTRYPSRPGTSYERIEAVPGSYLRGLDPRGSPFAAVRVKFKSDLPFPFTSYRCDLRILNRVRADGRIVCDIASPSRDFYWMAGRDLFVPVTASDGAWQGEIVVRLFGFDLRGVPDGDDARRAGLRSSLGSLKREAETLFRERAVTPVIPLGSIPEFRVVSAR